MAQQDAFGKTGRAGSIDQGGRLVRRIPIDRLRFDFFVERADTRSDPNPLSPRSPLHAAWHALSHAVTRSWCRSHDGHPSDLGSHRSRALQDVRSRARARRQNGPRPRKSLRRPDSSRTRSGLDRPGARRSEAARPRSPRLLEPILDRSKCQRLRREPADQAKPRSKLVGRRSCAWGGRSECRLRDLQSWALFVAVCSSPP